MGIPCFSVGFLLGCIQQLSLPYQPPSVALGRTTGTPERYVHLGPLVPKDKSFQVSYTHGRWGPNCLTTFWNPARVPLLIGEQPDP